MSSHDHPSKKNGLIAVLRGYFLAGILATVPLSVTLYLIYLILVTFDWLVAKILPDPWYQSLYSGAAIPGTGLLIAVAFFIVVGWLTSNFLGQFFLDLSERCLNRIPLVRIIYTSLRQVFETLATQSNAFRECVLVEYPHKGTWTIGFITGEATGDARSLGSDVVNVFLPMALNPTCGTLLMVPRKDTRPSGMNIEEGLKMVVSAGIITAEAAQKKAG